MRIACPVCGIRDSGEFSYGGDASVPRPALDAPEDAWLATVFERKNPSGAHREYWHHAGGCRAWLVVVRDTASHGVQSAELVGPWAETPSD